MSFNNVFGGSTLQPSDVSYRAVSLTADVTLAWADVSTSNTDYVARIMDVTPTFDLLSITMPPANQVSQGYDILFVNRSSRQFYVKKNDGTVIASISAGQRILVYINDNSTIAGGWDSFLYGVGTSEIIAASLVGQGIVGLGTGLSIALAQTEIFSNYSVNKTSDRAKLLVWKGGVGTMTLPLSSSTFYGFFFEVRNDGTGILTVQCSGANTIDNGFSSIALQPSESCILHANQVSKWCSVGRGRSQQFNFTQLTKSVTGGTTTLTNTEAANVCQKYSGILTSNQIVVLPPVVQVYYVSNKTTGAYSFTMQTPTPGDVVVIPQSQNAVLFCDGVNVINASTTVSGIASLLLSAGSAANPSLSFSANPNTGLFQLLANTISVSAGGVESLRATGSGLLTVDGAAATPSHSFINSPATGMYSPAANQWALSSNGVQSILVDANGLATIQTISSASRFSDSASITKKFHFVSTGITAGQDRSITVPDKDIILSTPYGDLLSSYSASGDTQVDIEGNFNSTYDVYTLIINNIVISNGGYMKCRLKIGGTYQTANYVFYTDTSSVGSGYSFINASALNSNAIYLTSDGGAPSAGDATNTIITIYNPSSTSSKKGIDYKGSSYRNGSGGNKAEGFGRYENSTSALTGVRIYFAQPDDSLVRNISSGNFQLYGLRRV